MEQPRNKGRSGSVLLLTILGIVFVALVAAVAGYLSWGHIREVGLRYGEPGANYLPVSVDGMMLAGTVMGAVDNIRGYKIRAWAIVSLWLGSGMTMTFNMVSAVERGMIAMGIAAIPAIALIVSVESIFHPSQRMLEKAQEAKAKIAKAVENVKTIVESAPVTEPAAKQVAKAAPVKAVQNPPQGIRGRAPMKKGKPGYRPNGPQKTQQAPVAQQPKRLAEADVVVNGAKPQPEARETVEVSAH